MQASLLHTISEVNLRYEYAWVILTITTQSRILQFKALY